MPQPDLKHCSARHAFTLIELLLAAALLAATVTAVGAVLAGGIRVWQAVQIHLRLESGVLPWFAVWERDIMNAQPFRQRPFAGTAGSMTIPVMLDTADGGRQPGFVRYDYDGDNRAVMRRTWLLDDPQPDAAWSEKWIRNVDEMAIAYRCCLTADGQWLATWNEPLRLPAGIRLTLTLSAPGSAPQRLERSIVLPHVHDARTAKKTGVQ